MLAARKGRCIEQAGISFILKTFCSCRVGGLCVHHRVEKNYTKQYDGTGFRMPYSYYSLADIHPKARMPATNSCSTGYSLWNQLIVEDTELPRPGVNIIFHRKKSKRGEYTCQADFIQ